MAMKKGTKKKAYCNEYYAKNRKEILKKMKEDYFKKRKKTPKCKMCGVKLPKELPAFTKYCDKCLYGKGHGEDAHRMAAVRWYRKNKLDKKKKNK